MLCVSHKCYKISWTILDKHLTFKYHLQNLKLKLNRAHCLLSKIRNFIKFSPTKNGIFAFFLTHLKYGCQICKYGDRAKIIEEVERTQNKTLWIINFKGPQVDYLYKESKIDRLKKAS